jgi:hypothetical protein
VVVEISGNKFKMCSICKLRKSVSFFHLKGIGRAGQMRYHSSCKDCANKNRVKRYFNKKLLFINNGDLYEYIVDIHYYNKEIRALDINKLMNDYIEAIYANGISKAR